MNDDEDMTPRSDELHGERLPAERPRGVKLVRMDRDVGPKEDPYARVCRQVILSDGRAVQLWDCALAMGSWLAVNGIALIGDEWHPAKDDGPEREFISLTGIDAHDFDELYYGEGGEGYVDEDIRAAELAAGWDSEP